MVLKQKEREMNSTIYYNIPFAKFQEQLNTNISHKGDNLFQSHFTDFCGKVAVVRLWIKRNEEDYRRFMTDLYHNAKATWNGRVFITPQSVIDAINQGKISPDPHQKVVSKSGDEKMPEMMDMVLYLTLASSFHTFPFNKVDYDPDKHQENSAWAGAAINPEIDLLTAMGFKVEKVGDNFRGLTDANFKRVKTACLYGRNKTVMLLVNSSLLNRASGAINELTGDTAIEHKSFGTHWITVDFIDLTDDTIGFWEYGVHRQIVGVFKMKKIIAGAIIIDDNGMI